MFHLHTMLWKIENDFRFHAISLRHRFQDLSSNFKCEYPLEMRSFDLKQQIQTTTLSVTWGLKIEQSELKLPTPQSIKESWNQSFINTIFYPVKHLCTKIQWNLLDSDQMKIHQSGGLGLLYQSSSKWKNTYVSCN